MKTFYQFYEEMMAANAAGTSGGFGADSPAAGPTAGRPSILGKGKMQRRKKVIGLGPGSRKRWMNKDG